jgi:hypothetical protein
MRFHQLSAGWILAMAAFGAVSAAHAQTATVASDSGDNYTLYGNFTGLNGGTGFQPWSIVSGDGGDDEFVNSQVDIEGPNTTNVFDLYDIGKSLPSTATRDFDAPLATGAQFSTSFLNEYVPPTGNVGVSLDDQAGDSLFTFYLPGNTAGGDPGDWLFVSGGISNATPTGGQDTSIPYQYYGALQIVVTQTDSDTYSLSVTEGTNYQNSGGVFTTTGSLIGDSPIAGVTYFTDNTNGSYDVEFNNLRIAAPAPEPSPSTGIAIGLCGVGALAVRSRKRREYQG